jgi:hypothetical protein
MLEVKDGGNSVCRLVHLVSLAAQIMREGQAFHRRVVTQKNSRG